MDDSIRLLEEEVRGESRVPVEGGEDALRRVETARKTQDLRRDVRHRRLLQEAQHRLDNNLNSPMIRYTFHKLCYVLIYVPYKHASI